MTTRRFYANAAPQRTLSGSLNSSASSLGISGTFAGWPTQFPFYATLDIGTASAEIVLVTAISSSTATIVRGQDGTAAITHASGATFDQTVVRQDFDEASAHTSANAGVHGVSGSVVGTTDSQTLTNKTLTGPVVTGTLAGANETLSGTLAVAGATTLGAVTTGAITAASLTATGNGVVTGVAALKTYTNEAAATTGLPTPATGTLVFLTAPTGGSDAGIFLWNGSAWKRSGPLVQAQSVSATVLTGTNVLTGSSTFATAYQAAPAVLVVPTNSSNFGIDITAVTPTGFSWRIFTTSGANVGGNTSAAFSAVAFGQQ